MGQSQNNSSSKKTEEQIKLDMKRKWDNFGSTPASKINQEEEEKKQESNNSEISPPSIEEKKEKIKKEEKEEEKKEEKEEEKRGTKKTYIFNIKTKSRTKK